MERTNNICTKNDQIRQLEFKFFTLLFFKYIFHFSNIYLIIYGKSHSIFISVCSLAF